MHRRSSSYSINQPSKPHGGCLTGLGQAIKESVSFATWWPLLRFGVEDKIAVLTAIAIALGCPPIGKAFLGQLVKKNRVGFLPEIADAFGKLVDAIKTDAAGDGLLRDGSSTGEQDRISDSLARQYSSAKSMSRFRRMPVISPACRSTSAARWSTAPSWVGYSDAECVDAR